MKGTAIVVSGPSGVGKNSVIGAVLRRDAQLAYSISCTTRPPRPGEREGAPYFFLDRASFERGIAEGRFVEYAVVYGHLYGTERRILEETMASGRDVLLDVDTQGAAQLAQVYPDSVRVYLLPPTMEELERRLRDRKTDDAAEIARRMAEFAEERKHIGLYTHIVVNHDVETAADELWMIVRADRLRRDRALPDLAAQGWTFDEGAAVHA